MTARGGETHYLPWGRASGLSCGRDVVVSAPGHMVFHIWCARLVLEANVVGGLGAFGFWQGASPPFGSFAAPTFTPMMLREQAAQYLDSCSELFESFSMGWAWHDFPGIAKRMSGSVGCWLCAFGSASPYLLRRACGVIDGGRQAFPSGMSHSFGVETQWLRTSVCCWQRPSFPAYVARMSSDQEFWGDWLSLQAIAHMLNRPIA